MMKVFSIAYKSVAYQLPTGWIEPLSVGPLAKRDIENPYRDCGQGDSIANLNDSFGELTAHYWVWKNLKNIDHIGFCHYRRYFNFITLEQSAQPKLLASPTPEILSFLAQDAQKDAAEHILKYSDVITTRQYCLSETIQEQFCNAHTNEIWVQFIDAIREFSPSWMTRYLPWFETSREFRFYPVFIMPWSIFDEFCSLLFPVLFSVHQKTGSIPHQQGIRFQLNRYPAYLAERFMMLYFHARALRLHGAQLIALESEA
jgi:hypothetical protein